MNKNSVVKLHTGREMPVFGLGTWQLTEDTAETVAYALDLGYPLIDTSGDYGTHPGIREALASSDVGRSEIYIVTKVEEMDDAYKATKAYVDELGLEYADLMLIHRPPPDGAGVALWEGLIKAQKEGFTRDIGVSNYSADLIDTLIESTGVTPVVNQIEWSPFGHSEDLMRYSLDKNIVVQAYSPLTRAKRLDEVMLVELGEKYNKSPAQILIRWNLQLGTIPLPKANHKQHLEENIDVFDFEIDEEDVERLNRLNEYYSSLGTLPYI